MRGQIEKQPLLLAVFGEEADAQSNGIARRVDTGRLAVDFHRTAAGLAHTENQLRQFGATGAHQPGKADNFTGADLKADRLHLFAVSQAVQRQARFPHRDALFLIEQVAQRAAHHHAHQLAGGQLVAHQAANILTVAQHADAIRQLVHLRHAVADINDCHAFIAQPFDQLEQSMRFA
ncbi:hypothetical protein D3C72_1590170 [compost metagenome]